MPRFRARGLTVHLNAGDAARDRYLHELDVFVTCSRWEGFNLPLLEAQAQGPPRSPLMSAPIPKPPRC